MMYATTQTCTYNTTSQYLTKLLKDLNDSSVTDSSNVDEQRAWSGAPW